MTRSAPHLRLTLFRTPAHDCPYLPGRRAATQFVDPYAALDPGAYERLLMHGFRRSGDHVYRPDCPACRRCISARIPVSDFRARRIQKRIWAASAGRLQAVERDPELRDEHYELYRRYLSARHPDGGMTQGGADAYMEFLRAEWSDTRFVELRLEGRLIAVAVMDRTPRSYSSVYTFFDPDEARLSPGVLSILWQIRRARSAGKDWLYLGYWIPGCRKMEYKTDYRPIELYSAGRWRRFERGDALGLPEAGAAADASARERD